MTKQQIIELLQSSKWTPSNSKAFTNYEFSETLAIWNKERAFALHCVRIKNHEDDTSLVINQIRPLRRFGVLFDTIAHTLNTNMKYMFAEELLRNEKEHDEFLRG